MSSGNGRCRQLWGKYPVNVGEIRKAGCLLGAVVMVEAVAA